MLGVRGIAWAQGYRIKSSGQTIDPRAAKDKAPPIEAFELPSAPTAELLGLPSVPGDPEPLVRPALTPERLQQLAAKPETPYVNHEALGDVLKKYVSKSGWVDYRGLQRDKESRELLHSYVVDLIAINPSSLSDPKDRLASWINLYNAFIIDEILKNYPVNSLLKIKDFFGARRFKMGEKEWSIIELEEEIFRKELNEPRAIFARVNGSSSGPRMQREPYDANKIDEQLEKRTLNFLADPANVRYDPKRRLLTLNSVFLWYEKDFLDLKGFLSTYLNLLPANYYWEYAGVDFQLNDAKLH